MNYYEEFVSLSRYSRFRDDLGRRETWPESVQRLIDWWCEKYPDHEKWFRETAQPAIENKEVMPSMRLLQTAGKAVDRDEVAAYNCSYTPIDDPRCFDEIMYILLCGTGVGFSVERQYVQKLPEIPEEFEETETEIIVPDSKKGWASSLRQLISLLYAGQVPRWSLDNIRPAGARLKTFGGRACLTGDTIVYKDRKKPRGYNEITLKELYQMKHGEGFWKSKPNHFKSVKLRSLDEDEGVFYRNGLVDVIDNGVAPIYEIVTKNGYRIKATEDHRFMNSAGDWQHICNFDIGDEIAVNGSPEKKTGSCSDCGCAISRRAKRCKPCFDKEQLQEGALETTARQRKVCRDALRDYCEHCEDRDTRLTVHHKDKDVYNNEPENLETLCEPCHQLHHAKERTFGDAYSHKYLSYDEIISIEYVGQDRVYDLVMDAPNHNFVANGFVSHNSGPQPLQDLFHFTVELFQNAAGRKLSSLECHDLVCKIGDVVVVGGVRRSALISLSNLSDDRMRMAKSGQWWLDNPQRTLANNSACYTEKPEFLVFLDEWRSLYESKSGERGVFNRKSAQKQAGRNGRRDANYDFGTNPCSEIVLRPRGFCNLTEVVVRPNDDYDRLGRKVEIATILGTFQSTLTNFRYLRSGWKKNAEEERLLGVSLTGIMDHPRLSHYTREEGSKSLDKILEELRDHAIKTNERYAKDIGINPSVAITCVKPSGTVSQLCNTSSGIHPRFSPYYLRSVRGDKKDPLAHFMIDKGFPYEEDVHNNDNYVFYFPIKSPEGSMTADDVGALDQLSLWEIYQDHWCEHKPSMTCYYNDDEFLAIGNWVWNRFDKISGISFLPRADHIYQQAPYQKLSKEEYEEWLKKMPVDIDWRDLVEYENDDFTTGSQELACSGSDSCDI